MYCTALRFDAASTQAACRLKSLSSSSPYRTIRSAKTLTTPATAKATSNLPFKGRRRKNSGTQPASPALTPLPVDPLTKYKALVLDSGYRPIDVVNWQKAICLNIYEKVDVLEYFDGVSVHSAHSAHGLPAVVRVRMFVRKHWRYAKVALSRRNIMLRDRFACQYCGARENLTLDHVKPSSKGGLFSWTNCVTACTLCNSKKGSKSLKKMGWVLRKQPREPSAQDVAAIAGFNVGPIRTIPKEWSEYLFPGEAPCFQGPPRIRPREQAVNRL